MSSLRYCNNQEVLNRRRGTESIGKILSQQLRRRKAIVCQVPLLYAVTRYKTLAT
ncbi:hypothetical protein ANCDUO_00356 [Ancylostoma duodenale]|uniref:Uncharacterized protein n=1 Tax=Ancylostoma duodenale TaxID=51022 RepID=A0A0C2HCC6_9BILA|nr:hypothetical protein ANCDUO_00356 [Ancylostoma duodenale]